MDDTEFYRALYRQLEHVTPLRFDCGRLCGGACCRSDPEQPGMYLFPGEEAMFAGKTGYTVTDAVLPGYGKAPLLACEGACKRSERPLACRVFPLAPAFASDSLSLRLDPRGRRACPLCRGGVGALSGEFSSAARAVFASLAEDDRTAAFLRALAAHLDEFSKPL